MITFKRRHFTTVNFLGQNAGVLFQKYELTNDGDKYTFRIDIWDKNIELTFCGNAKQVENAFGDEFCLQL